MRFVEDREIYARIVLVGGSPALVSALSCVAQHYTTVGSVRD